MGQLCVQTMKVTGMQFWEPTYNRLSAYDKCRKLEREMLWVELMPGCRGQSLMPMMFLIRTGSFTFLSISLKSLQLGLLSTSI